MGIGDVYTDDQAATLARDEDRRHHATRAATHEPEPAGTGAVILEFAVARAGRKSLAARGRGYPVLAEAFEKVSEALTARAEMGKAKYGTYLRADNGRNALVDLYQEILDAIMYSEQCYFEVFGDGTKYANDEARPIHLMVGAEKLDQLYMLAAEIAPYVKKAA